MSIDGRLRVLEQRLLPAAEADDAEENAWWQAAPPAVLVYYAALEAEMLADARWHTDPDAAVNALYAARPVLRDVQFAVQLDAIHRAPPVSLRRVQREVLDAARSRLTRAVTPECGGYNEESDRQVRLRLYGFDFDGDWRSEGYRRASAAYEDRTGETWVGLWRETAGQRSAATLATLGFHAAEVALLDADPDGGTA